MKRLLLFIPIVLFFLFCSCDLEPPGPEMLSNEEHAVLSAVIDSIKRIQTTETLDVYDLTTNVTNCTSLHIAFLQDSVGSDSLLDNYNSANDTRYALDMEKLPDYVMLKDTDESDPYSGYISFTRPGISNDCLTAIVEYSIISAPLCGSGMAALLEKHDGEWLLIWKKLMWIS